MMKIRHSSQRGQVKTDWLDTYHTFSFGSYHDPQYVGFQDLIVINEDTIAPDSGFGAHSHADMEIITYVISGELEHKDSLGNSSVIRAGDVQYMSAGTGVVHSEYNPSKSQPVHLLQMWLHPTERGLSPRYDQRHFGDELSQGELRLAASGDDHPEAIQIRTDARLYITRLRAGQSLSHDMRMQRAGWLQVVYGRVSVNGQAAESGDGLSWTDERRIDVVAESDAEFIFYDLAIKH